MRTIMVTEIPYGGGKHRLHQFEMPDLNEPKGYTQLGSLEAFRHGARKGAPAQDKEFHRAGVNWGPTALYRCIEKWEWEQDQTNQAISMQRVFPDYAPGDNYEGGEGKSLDEIPRTTHEGLYEFYQAIGFDRKARGYVNAQGQPIKYSTIDIYRANHAKRTDKAPEKTTEPEM